jgi:hypothetical protein
MPHTYTGDGAIDIPNARDVQVAFMDLSTGESYIVAAFYDVVEEKYGYNLYSYTYALPSPIVTKMYTFYFRLPGHMPGYTPNECNYPIFGDGSPVPTHGGEVLEPADYYPGPLTKASGKMGYNRISIDVDATGKRIVFVMTDGTTEKMYLAAGEIAPPGVILFTPYIDPDPIAVSSSVCSGFPLPPLPTPGFPWLPTPPLIYPAPLFNYTCTFTAPWTYSAGNWDYYDAGPGIYVRFDGTYYYQSYYPIDEIRFVSKIDPTIGKVIEYIVGATTPMNPLIWIRPQSYMYYPGKYPVANTIWPDVAFDENDKFRIVCYINNPMPGVNIYTGEVYGIEDLYIMDMSYKFDYIYDETSREKAFTFINTADGRPIRYSLTYIGVDSPKTGYSYYNYESLTKSLPLVPGEEIRANLDISDLQYAVTFAYSGVPDTGYRAYYSYPRWESDATEPLPRPDFSGKPEFWETIHSPLEYGKKNVYLRYGWWKQAVLTNGSIVPGHLRINDEANVAPDVAFKPGSSTDVIVAWASENAGSLYSLPYTYIGLQLDLSKTLGTPPFKVNSGSYWLLPNTPSLYNAVGDYPLVALNKHKGSGITSLYGAFAQENSTGTYTIQHKQHSFLSSAYWRIGNEDEEAIAMHVGPNPFSNVLQVQLEGIANMLLCDIQGRQLLQAKGNASELNSNLARIVPQLASGTYLLSLQPNEAETASVFKLSKN